jgi:hypothetical protein
MRKLNPSDGCLARLITISAKLTTSRSPQNEVRLNRIRMPGDLKSFSFCSLPWRAVPGVLSSCMGIHPLCGRIWIKLVVCDGIENHRTIALDIGAAYRSQLAWAHFRNRSCGVGVQVRAVIAKHI